MATPIKTLPPRGGFYFDSDGVYALEVSLHPVMGLEDMLKDAASKQAVPLTNIGRGAGVADCAIHALAWGNGDYAVGSVVDRLTFNTDYRIVQEGEEKWLTPAFGNGDIPMNFTWVSPSPFRYEFLVVVHSSGNVLLAVHDIPLGKLYAPPIGNLYGDQRVCMGSSFSRSGSKIEQFQWALGLLNTDPWGGDLTIDYTNNIGPKFIRFSIEQEGLTLEPRVADSEWIVATNPILCEFYERFFKVRV